MSDLPRDPAEPGGDDPELDPENLAIDDDPVEPEIEPDEEPDEPEPQPQQHQSRRERSRNELAELRREVAELRAQRTEPARQPAIDPAAARAAEDKFFADLELVPPQEAFRQLYQRARSEFGQAILGQQINTQDRLDQQSYDSTARTNPLYERYRDKVEALVASERARGNIVGRRQALAWLYFEDVERSGARAAGQQRQQGAARVASQTVRPVNPRGTVARGGGRRTQDEEDEALLRSISMQDI